jgi:hypothetical protein
MALIASAASSGRMALAIGLLAGVAGCGSDDAGDAIGASDRAGQADNRCAWATRGDRETNNIAYPDAAATYWAVSYDLAPGETIELQGTFPAARYASFISYGPYGGAIDVLTDRDIQPDAGSSNPFRGDDGGGGDEHRYTVVIVPQRDPGDGDGSRVDPNVISARPEPGSDAATRAAPTTTAGPDGSAPPSAPDPREANLLGAGGGHGTQGTVIYRVYVPDAADDPTGGAGLPEATVVGADGSRQAIPTCPSPGASPRALEFTHAYGPPTDRPAPPQPVFIRPEAGAANLYPNPDNVYIATIAEHQPGRVVVIRGMAPTFPDPAAGRPVGSGEQLRYWSLCTNEYRKPYPVSFCTVDRDVVLDDQGLYTFVVSTPEDRPANAIAANGVTWLEWGSNEVHNLLLLRHLLADPSFAESATNLDHGTVATASMGAYAPVAIYCQRDAFEQHGPDGCPA